MLRRWLDLGRRRKLFRLVRTARFVQHSSNPFAHLELASALEKVPLGLPAQAFIRLENLGLREAAITCVRQRLVASIIYKHVLPELLLHLHQPNRPVELGVPKAWRHKLRELGVRVRPLQSWLKWVSFLFLFYLQGVRTGLQLLGWVERLSALEIATDDNVDLMAIYPDGLRVSIHLDLYGRPHEKLVTVVGESGTLQCLFDPNCVRFSSDMAGEWQVADYACERNDMFLEEARDFLKVAAGRATPSCGISDGVRVLRCVEAVRLSTQHEKTIQLADIC